MKTVSWCNMKRTRMLNGNNNSMILANNEDEKRAPEVAAFWAVSTLLGLLSQHGKVDKMSYDFRRKKVERNRVWEEFRPCTCLLRLRKLILGFLITEIFAGAQKPFLTPFRLLIHEFQCLGYLHKMSNHKIQSMFLHVRSSDPMSRFENLFQIRRHV